MENQNQVKHSKTRSFKEIVMNTPYASKWVAVALLAFLLLILLGMTEGQITLPLADEALLGYVLLLLVAFISIMIVFSRGAI